MKKISLILIVTIALQSISTNSFASITLSILSPAPYRSPILVMVPTTFNVSVNVQSTFQLSSVTINAGSVQQLLTYNSSTGNFEGTLTLKGFNEGDTVPLKAIATDYYNNQASTTEQIIYYNPPVITVDNLLDESFARPLLPVNIKCSDRDSCELTITFSTTSYSLVNRFKDSISLILDLSRFNGQSGPLNLSVTNKRGQQGYLKFVIYVETSPYINEVYASDRKIIDFNYNKVLSDSVDYVNYNSHSLQISDIYSNAKVSIPFSKPVEGAVLTKYGALFGGIRPDNIPDIYDWNNSVLDSLGPLNSGFTAIGDYAI